MLGSFGLSNEYGLASRSQRLGCVLGVLLVLALCLKVTASPGGNIGSDMPRAPTLMEFSERVQREAQKGETGTLEVGADDEFPALTHCLTGLPPGPMREASVMTPGRLMDVLGGEDQYMLFLELFLRKTGKVALEITPDVSVPHSPFCVDDSTPIGQTGSRERSTFGIEPRRRGPDMNGYFPREYLVILATDFFTRREYRQII